MDDLRTEEQLRGYRPVGPPLSLRHRVVAAAPVRRIWPWALAAAAMLTLTFGLHLASANLASAAGMRPAPDLERGTVRDLTERLGGDSSARSLAEFLVSEHQLQAEAGSLPPGRRPAPAEEGP
jgi:hypothetical protein